MDFLSGGGAVAELIRSLDWSATSVGPMQAWSPALRMVIKLMLANRFPMILWWGPDFVQFYNDAYRPIPGNKHPRSMGQRASECWSEIWHVIGPLIERPFRGGPATWDDDIFLEINRHGFVEESHFTIAYSPVPDDTAPGGIGGVLATVHEITDKVVGERRVVVLSDLRAQSAEARTAEEACSLAALTLSHHAKDIPFALLYLVDADRRHARLAGTAGVAEGQRAAARIVPLEADRADSAAWPLPQALDSEAMQTIPDLAAHLGKEVPPGPWSDPPHTAVVVPVRSNRAHHLAGFLVAGVSARLLLDRSYQDFLELVSTQIATAIANAREYEEEKKRAEALAEIDRAKTVFFSNVSHEFRTPLALMLGPIEELLAGSHAELPPTAKGQLEVAHRNSLRLLRLVNTLLDFSRFEAGRVQARFEPTDLAACTADLVSVFRAATERAGLALTVDCPSLHEPVYVDRNMWEKVVLNLISNAFKFTLEGEIAVTLRATAGVAELRVRDTGVGIPAEAVPRLFERFYRVPDLRGRTHEGTGIGLALVQELVKLHGGGVRVESRFGEGSTFVVTVPLGKDHLPADQVGAPIGLAPTAVGAASFVEEALRWLPDDTMPTRPDTAINEGFGRVPQPAMGPNPGRPRVLVADDNADMRQYLVRLLVDRYDVQAVPDGEAALQAAREHRPDLVLSDVMMPRLDGLGLVRELRADPTLEVVPVILLSARAGEESRVEGMREGADDYLIKPFSARELLARVGAHLEMAALRKRSEESLRHRSEQFETLINRSPLGVFLVDADLRIMQVNPVSLPVFGDILDLVGRTLDEVMRILWPPEQAAEVVRLFRRTLETGESYETSDFTQYRVDRQAIEHYEWRIDRILLPEGRHGVVCYFRDISEQKRAVEAVIRSNEELQQFAYVASHDLQEPLRTIKAFLKLLDERYGPDLEGRAREYIGYAVDAATRMSDLIRDLLEYSRLERQGRPFEPTDTGQVLEDVVADLHTAIAEAHATVEHGPMPRVMADPIQLRPLFQNLLSNALKFRSPERPCRVWVAARRCERTWAFQVRDNGLGIPAKAFDRIFMVFQRLHTREQYPGTGIGLALCKRIVERHGGQIWVESLPGEGSSFFFTLPAGSEP